jgi:hypothetical protein
VWPMGGGAHQWSKKQSGDRGESHGERPRGCGSHSWFQTTKRPAEWELWTSIAAICTDGATKLRS